MIEYLLTGWLFLAGLTLDGSTIGTAYYTPSVEIQTVFSMSPRKIYKGWQLSNERGPITPLAVIGSYLAPEGLDHYAFTARVMRIWHLPDGALHPEVGIGLYGSSLRMNADYHSSPHSFPSAGVSLMAGLFSTLAREGGIRITLDVRLLGRKVGPDVGVTVSLVASLSSTTEEIALDE